MNSGARTDRQMFIVIRGMPVALFVGSVALIMSGHSNSSAVVYHRVLLEAPFLAWGAFLLTVGEVRADNDQLEYRRFYRWRKIPYTAIQRCMGSLHPGLGFLQLKGVRGKVYFVVLRPAFGQSSDLVGYINERLSGAHAKSHSPANGAYRGMHGSYVNSKLLCLAAGAAGMIYGLLLTWRFPEFFSASSWANFPRWLSFSVMLLVRAQTWPWSLLTGVALVIVILRMRFRKSAWILAAAVGALIGHCTIQMWH